MKAFSLKPILPPSATQSVHINSHASYSDQDAKFHTANMVVIVSMSVYNVLRNYYPVNEDMELPFV